MILEFALISLAYVARGQSVRATARAAGRVVGRTSGSLRRVRAEVERVQARAEALGGEELRANRAEIAARFAQLRAIQAEASSLLNVNAARMVDDGGAARAFSDAELATALGAAAGPNLSSSSQPPPSTPRPASPSTNPRETLDTASASALVADIVRLRN